MENKLLAVLISLGVIVTIGLVIVLLVLSQTKLSPKATMATKASSLEECKTLTYNGERRINLVFFADDKNAEKYSRYMSNIKPFAEYQNAFNVYYIDNYKPECTIYQNIALFCYSSELIKKSASCPNDYIIVLDERESSIRSSSYLNVISINKRHPLSVMAHEFGHAFASLAEEYVPAYLSSSSKNCVKECEEFGDKNEGCFAGCSKSEYYRSINAGVMRTLNSDKYGIFNELLLSDNLQMQKPGLITGRIVDEAINCSERSYYLIVGNYSGERIIVKNKTEEIGCLGGNGIGEFSYGVFDENGNLSISGKFNPNLLYTDSPSGIEAKIEIDGEVFNYQGEFSLKLPVQKNLKTISIQSSNQELAEVLLQDIGARACFIE